MTKNDLVDFIKVLSRNETTFSYCLKDLEENPHKVDELFLSCRGNVVKLYKIVQGRYKGD